MTEDTAHHCDLLMSERDWQSLSATGGSEGLAGKYGQSSIKL